MLGKPLSVAGKAVDILIGGLLLAIVMITLFATGNRYLFGGAVPWSEELNLLLWVWMIQLGALRTSHIRITYFIDRLPARIRRAINLIMSLLSIAALLVLTWGAMKMAGFVSGDVYVSMPWLSEKYAFYALFLVGPVWILRILADELGWAPAREE